MLNINVLLKRMKNRLPSPVFEAVDNQFFLDILQDETLPLFSEYYPKIVKGIRVSYEHIAKVVDLGSGLSGVSKYAIPMEDERFPFTGISAFYYIQNHLGGTFTGPSSITALAEKITSVTNAVTVAVVAHFEEPNILELDPAPYKHIDFTVNMYRVRRLDEIKTGYHEWVKKLFEADCKIALYNKFYTAADGGIFGGIELKDYVSKFEDFEDKREELIEKFEEDFYKDPERIDEMANYNQSILNYN